GAGLYRASALAPITVRSAPMRYVHAALVALLLTAAAQTDPHHDLLDRLTGHWVMRGVIAKQQTTHDVEAQWVLNKEYLQIHETPADKAASGRPQYEAITHVAWDPKAAEYAILWLDTTGVANFPPAGVGHAKPAGDTIPFVFKDPAGGGDRTTFSYD